ncbi:MAG TPA: hypothetical protein VMU08_01080 [Rhizomicrobium sp.]|nr:hypothetical protein [Rhizomicrobium sp.]
MASIQIVSGLVLMASASSLSSAMQAQQHQALVAVRDHCRTEIREVCTASSSAALVGCLNAHRSWLSTTCQGAVAGAAARTSATSAN